MPKNPAGPLLCWDIYMDYYNRRLAMMNSLRELNGFVQKKKWRHRFDFEKKLLIESNIILITSTSLKIEFASSNLSQMNGYEPQEVIGKSPKIFQGIDTSVETRKQISEAIIKRIPFTGSLINYRKDGKPYNCIVEEHPVWDTRGQLVNFIAFERVA